MDGYLYFVGCIYFKASIADILGRGRDVEKLQPVSVVSHVELHWRCLIEPLPTG